MPGETVEGMVEKDNDGLLQEEIESKTKDHPSDNTAT